MVVRIFFSLSERKRALLSRDIFFLFFFSHPEKRVSREEEERKEEEREEGEEQQFFLEERKRHEKKTQKRKKKPRINFAPTPGTCTRKQRKEGTERENGVNAGDACVRF